MNTAHRQTRGHSADVQMHLSVHGHLLGISRLGPDYVVLDAPLNHAPTDAQVFHAVDGIERRWRVKLVDGLSASLARTRIAVTDGV